MHQVRNARDYGVKSATAEFDFALAMDELPAFPQGPVDKGDVPNQDTGFIMDTLFGESPPVPSDKPNSGEGQAQGSTSPDAQTPGTPPAPPSSAPAANGGDGSPQPGPSLHLGVCPGHHRQADARGDL